MSEINITVGNSNAGITIDTERMRTRLENIRTQLEESIQNGVGDPEALQDRIDKVNSQLERLDQYSGQNVNVSANYAARELERGLEQISDGLNFIDRNRGGLDNSTALEQRLLNWQQKLFDHQGHLNTFG